MKNKWKTVAIVFIIISILEFSLIIWAYSYATESIEKENTCSINVCANYNSYYYESYENMCYCYEDENIVHQEYLG